MVPPREDQHDGHDKASVVECYLGKEARDRDISQSVLADADALVLASLAEFRKDTGNVFNMAWFESVGVEVGSCLAKPYNS